MIELKDFMKKFPSLGKCDIFDELEDDIEIMNEHGESQLVQKKTGYHYVYIQDIDLNCIDKKIVKEILFKYLGDGNNQFALTEYDVDRLRGELGI